MTILSSGVRWLALGVLAVGLMAATPALAGDIKFKNCSSSDQTNIKSALKWLKNNMAKIDSRMGKNRLMKWPGKSRSKFVKKLSKNLKFVCKNDKKKCKPNRDGTVLMGKVVPVFAQKTIQLCTNNYGGQVNYVSTIAHEIAHLVRLNAHRTNCEKMYKNPRFSKSVGLAAKHGFNGNQYNYRDYTKHCN